MAQARACYMPFTMLASPLLAARCSLLALPRGHRAFEAYASRPWRIGIGSTGWELPGTRTHRHEFQRKTRSNRNARTHMAHIQPRSFCVFLPRSRRSKRAKDSWSQWKENLHTYVRTYVRSHVISLCYGVTKIVSWSLMTSTSAHETAHGYRCMRFIFPRPGPSADTFYRMNVRT